MDAVCEIVDARIPLSTRNPDVDELTAGKPRLIVLNRVGPGRPARRRRRWAAVLPRARLRRARGQRQGRRRARRSSPPPSASCCAVSSPPPPPRGRSASVVRVMVLGDPERGQVHLHQQGRPPQDRPRRGPPRRHPLQAVGARGRRRSSCSTPPASSGREFDDPEVGKRLAFTGAVKDDVLDIEELACYLMDYLGPPTTPPRPAGAL